MAAIDIFVRFILLDFCGVREERSKSVLRVKNVIQSLEGHHFVMTFKATLDHKTAAEEEESRSEATVSYNI